MRFIDSQKRLDRAVFHAETFNSIWKPLLDPKTYETAIQMNSDWTSGVARFVHPSIPENDLAVELGEMFYQLRAALDSLVYKSSVLAETIDPPSNENRVEFPICIDPDRFKKSTVNDLPFPQKLRDWIETIQPYNTAKTDGTEFGYINAMLQILHDCARKDRHRKLHLVAAVPTSLQYSLSMYPGRLIACQPIEANLFEGKDEFLWFSVAGFNRVPGNIKLNSEVLVEVTIDEIPLLAPGQSGLVFQGMFFAVKRVIKYFEDWHK